MERDFTDESQARIFRDKKREEGLAASLFTYGKDRFRVKFWEKWNDDLKRTQWSLSDHAYKVSSDIADLNKVKELISKPDFYNDIEDMVFIAKKLNAENWFIHPADVIDFFDNIPEDQLIKIKELVDTSLSDYDEEWNDKSHQEVTG
jgi:hypothetical protein